MSERYIGLINMASTKDLRPFAGNAVNYRFIISFYSDF
jgi:hypothetical protein